MADVSSCHYWTDSSKEVRYMKSVNSVFHFCRYMPNSGPSGIIGLTGKTPRVAFLELAYF